MIITTDKLNKVEINKIEFAKSIVDIFTKYREIDNLDFVIDGHFVSEKNGDAINTFYKEKFNIHRIGFLSTDKIPDLNNEILSFIQYSNSQLKNSNIIPVSCLFHFIIVGETILLRSNIDLGLSSGSLTSFNLHSIYDYQNECPQMSSYLQKLNCDYLLEEDFMQNCLSDINFITLEQLKIYPKNYCQNTKGSFYDLKKVSFYRENLFNDIKSFYGFELCSKLRESDLESKININLNSNFIIKKKI